MSTTPPSLNDLPGEDLIRKGLDDLESRKITIESLLVSIARPRLVLSGLSLAGRLPIEEHAELALYRLLGESGEGDPYSRYNALLRRLNSFTSALTSRISNLATPPANA